MLYLEAPLKDDQAKRTESGETASATVIPLKSSGMYPPWKPSWELQDESKRPREKIAKAALRFDLKKQLNEINCLRPTKITPN